MLHPIQIVARVATIFSFTLSCISGHAQTLNAELLTRRCRDGVLLIDDGRGGTGTGFLISAQGHVLTNRHVIEDTGYRAEASFPNGEAYPYEIIRTDEAIDIALIKLEGFRCLNCVVLPILQTGNGPTGAEVAAIGNPEGLRFTTTKGIISNEILHPAVDFMLQTDVATNAGNSGGPLLNCFGQVVGIMTARLERGDWGDRDFQNMNFAINASAVRRFVRQQRLETLPTVSLIGEAELSARLRTLSAAEVAAQEQAELERVRLGREREAVRDQLEKRREAERAELEREQIRRQLVDAMELDQLNAEQKKEVGRISFEGQKRIAAAQAKSDEQRISDAARRATQTLEAEDLRLARERQNLLERRRQWHAGLPTRLAIRLGGGVHDVLYVSGPTDEVDFSALSIGWFGQAALAYRFDVNASRDCGSAAGVFVRFGALPGEIVDGLAKTQLWTAIPPAATTEYFVEYEAGILVREVLRVSGGVGRQNLLGENAAGVTNAPSSFTYGIGTLAFQLRLFKRIEVCPQAIVQFGGDFPQPVLRGELAAQVRLGIWKG